MLESESMNWETVIGLEVHTQLATHSKLFSGAPTTYGAEPNTQACAIDLGLPGVLPVLNEQVIEFAIRFALGSHSKINCHAVFARKNYFYPDLPKGYQISQHDCPIVYDGHLDIVTDEGHKRIGITRAHLEEDAGKSLHGVVPGQTGIDLNRAGTPLLEIVSEPDLRSATEAVTYLKSLHSLVRHLGICDGNMQEGSFRVDANVSIRPRGSNTLGTRTELKNINSFRFVERAINYEIQRQIDVVESGQAVVQETRLYDAEKDCTKSMRSKENADDYRYFPDPDLLPLQINEALIAKVRNDMPELPEVKQRRYVDSLGLTAEDATAIVNNLEMMRYFEALLLHHCDAKTAANWLLGEITAKLNKEQLAFTECPVTPELLTGLLQRIADQTISSKIAKTVFAAIWQGEGDADSIIEAKGLRQVTDSGAIEQMVTDIVNSNPEQVEQYRAGKEKVFGFFVGQVMKASKGKANPQQVNEVLRKLLMK